MVLTRREMFWLLAIFAVIGLGQGALLGYVLGTGHIGWWILGGGTFNALLTCFWIGAMRR